MALSSETKKSKLKLSGSTRCLLRVDRRVKRRSSTPAKVNFRLSFFKSKTYFLSSVSFNKDATLRVVSGSTKGLPSLSPPGQNPMLIISF